MALSPRELPQVPGGPEQITPCPREGETVVSIHPLPESGAELTKRNDLRFPRVDLPFELDRTRRFPRWLFPSLLVAALLLGATGYSVSLRSAPPAPASDTLRPQAFDTLREGIQAFPLDADDIAVATFLSRLVAAASDLPREQKDLLKALWTERREALDAARKQAVVDAAASLQVPVRFRSRTPGAEVSVNSGEFTPLPASLEGVRAGVHAYEVRAPGFGPFRSSFTVEKPDPLTFEVNLERLMGQVRIEVTPEDSAWSLSSVDAEPFTQQGIGFGSLPLPTGRYRVTFTREGHDLIVQDIAITENGQARAAAAFTEGRLSVRAGTEALPLFVNGVRRGLTPQSLTLRTGTHDIEVEFGNGQRVKQTILVSNREPARVDFRPLGVASASASTQPNSVTVEPSTLTVPTGAETPRASLAVQKPAEAIPSTVSPPKGLTTSDATTVFSLNQVTQRPVPTRQISPPIPASFRRYGVAGSVQVEILIDHKGLVFDARVLRSSHRELDEPTLDAARQWKFKPALRDGKPVPVRVAIPFVFRAE